MGSTYGYLGPAGTFTEMAVLKYRRPEDMIIPFRTINDVIAGVKDRIVERGVIPLENSREGSVNQSLDLLYREWEIKIIGELTLPIEHFLYAAPGVKLCQIKEVISHPQATAQASEYLSRYLPQATIIYTDSTAAAAESVAGTMDSGLIGSRRIAQLYNLAIVAANIEGGVENHTRFAVISNADAKDDYTAGGMYKTSLVCAPKVNRPGILYEFLGEFARRNINLTKIESRPTKKKLGDYLFYIDFEGHQSQKRIKESLNIIKEKSILFRILGSYLQQEANNNRGGEGKC